MQATPQTNIVCTFHDVAGFEQALRGLLKAGFDAGAISVLGSHDAIVEHFGRVPQPEELADAPDTPREALDTERAVRKAVEFIAETLALVTEVGTAAAAYAVGGPVGVAAGSADMAELNVENVLSRFVDSGYHERFEQNVRDGGLICWVHTTGKRSIGKARKALEAAGGTQIHQTDV